MDQQLEKLITWLRGEFLLLKRDLANYIIRKVGDNTDAMNNLAKTNARIADALEKQKVLPITMTHQVNIPEIKVPEPKVTVNIPEIKLPKIEIPSIIIPPIKLPIINVPEPKVTVNVQEREDKVEIKLLTQILKKLDSVKPYDIWNDVAKKTPLPVILVNENTEYYTAGGAAPVSMIASGGGNARPMNNTAFGSSSLSVTTHGAPVEFPDVSCASVTITANETNTDVVTVGASNVVGAKVGRIGQPLEPLQSFTISIDNINKLYLDSVVNGEGVSYTYVA